MSVLFTSLLLVSIIVTILIFLLCDRALSSQFPIIPCVISPLKGVLKLAMNGTQEKWWHLPLWLAMKVHGSYAVPFSLCAL